MAESRKRGSGIFGNPPVGKGADLGGPGPLSVLKARDIVSPWPAATNNIASLNTPPVAYIGHKKGR